MSTPRMPARGIPWDVAIAGGGIAGSVAAIHLAGQGAKVWLGEKEAGPHHKVCGEFLSTEGAALLRATGLDLQELGAATIRSFRLHGPRRSSETKLPSSALGISRYRLDEALLKRAEAAGAVVERGVLVKEKLDGLDGLAGAIVLDTTAGKIEARRLVVATGKSEFRSVQTRHGRDDGMIGYKMHVRLKPSVAKRAREACDLFVFKGGYGGLAPVEDGLFNFCVLLEKSKLREIGAEYDDVAYYVANHCRAASRYLDGAEPVLRHPVTVAGIPYGFIRRTKPERGVFCVGDQLAVIPSLTGDGMSIAAMSGLAAAQAIFDPRLKSLRPANASLSYQRALRPELRNQIEAAYRLHLLFKSPRLCDLSTYLVKAFPSLVDAIFARTRTQQALRQPSLGGARGAKRLRA